MTSEGYHEPLDSLTERTRRSPPGDPLPDGGAGGGRLVSERADGNSRSR